MSETDTFEHIRKIRELLPSMVKYNTDLIDAFEEFARCQNMEEIIKVLNLKQDPVAMTSFNTYKHIRLLHWITDIAARELSAGYVPMTVDTSSYNEAIDKYRRITFMLRRYELMDVHSEKELVDEAVEYIIDHRISVIAIHDIIVNDVCFSDHKKAISRWAVIFKNLGKEKDALLLEMMP